MTGMAHNGSVIISIIAAMAVGRLFTLDAVVSWGHPFHGRENPAMEVYKRDDIGYPGRRRVRVKAR